MTTIYLRWHYKNQPASTGDNNKKIILDHKHQLEEMSRDNHNIKVQSILRNFNFFQHSLLTIYT